MSVPQIELARTWTSTSPDAATGFRMSLTSTPWTGRSLTTASMGVPLEQPAASVCGPTIGGSLLDLWPVLGIDVRQALARRLSQVPNPLAAEPARRLPPAI